MCERSFLFVPGNRPERFDKAIASGSDAVILDLEDAVPWEQKSFARECVAKWLKHGKEVYVRVNADAEWFHKDVEAVIMPGLKGIVFPKAESIEQIEMLISKLPCSVVVIPTIETALGAYNVMELASIKNVTRLAFGSVDFQLDTGIKGDDNALLYVRSKIVLASRVGGLLPPIDGVTTAIEDEEILQNDIRKSVDLGFGAKLCIHPKQVAAVNAGFLPSSAEIAWAKKVIAVATASGGAACRLGNELIDKPLIDKAKRLLGLAERAGIL